jgi:hypothetical protein
MSFLVLVLGALLSFGGAAALYSGYGNVEVVRGWTAIIAGTTALSAGVMTIGISFVLRCLVRLQAFLEIERGLVPLLNEIASNRDLCYTPPGSASAESAVAPAGPATALVTSTTLGVVTEGACNGAGFAAPDARAGAEGSGKGADATA